MLHWGLFPERRVELDGFNDSTSLSALLPWQHSSKHQQWEFENLLLRAFDRHSSKDGFDCTFPWFKGGGHSEISSPYLMIPSSLFLTGILPLSVHIHTLFRFLACYLSPGCCQKELFAFILCFICPRFHPKGFPLLENLLLKENIYFKGVNLGNLLLCDTAFYPVWEF